MEMAKKSPPGGRKRARGTGCRKRTWWRSQARATQPIRLDECVIGSVDAARRVDALGEFLPGFLLVGRQRILAPIAGPLVPRHRLAGEPVFREFGREGVHDRRVAIGCCSITPKQFTCHEKSHPRKNDRLLVLPLATGTRARHLLSPVFGTRRRFVAFHRQLMCQLCYGIEYNELCMSLSGDSFRRGSRKQPKTMTME